MLIFYTNIFTIWKRIKINELCFRHNVSFMETFKIMNSLLHVYIKKVLESNQLASVSDHSVNKCG